MNVGMNNNNKIKREDDCDISIGTQDTYSQNSTQEDDEYKEDSFLLIETENSEVNDDENSFLDIKRDYLRRKKNVNKECCRRILEYNEDYFLMRIREKELEREKLDKIERNKLKVKYEENVRNMKNAKILHENGKILHENAKILHEIRECKAAIRKATIRKIIYKDRIKVYLKCNRESRGGGGGGGQGDMETNVEE